MKINNLRIKLLVTVFMVVLVWQISKLWSLYSEKSNPEEFSEKLRTQQILITVYYEALCPDSRGFVIKQLLPTFDSIEDYIELQLIPYGKAETIEIDNDYKFECQHGEAECEANIIHACAINKIRDSRKQLELVACMIRNNKQPMSIFKMCASELDEYKAILDCSKSIEGRRLLMKYGQVTKALNPKIIFIPTVTLDNELGNQALILKNLLREVCDKLEVQPKECKR